MKKLIEYISGIKLPKYILVKNLQFENDYDLDSPVARGEAIHQAESYESLKKLIPKPAYPVDEYKVSLLDSKYGQINDNELEYDDTLFDLTEENPNDYEIFGESYSIIFLCPPDENLITRSLVEQYKKERNLMNLWKDGVDRLHLFPFYILEITSDEFMEKLNKVLEKEFKRLESPPTPEEWAELDDYL